MSKFKVTVNLQVELEIELNDDHFTEEMLKEWSQHMYNDIRTKRDHAEHIGQYYVRSGGELYGIDGYADTEIKIEDIDERCDVDVEEQKEQG